ncbi:MAG TPA: LysR family transcriptional regulator [Ancylobacter sp.]
MTDWENLRHFAALARSGTFLGAAKELGVEHATVARRVSRLEKELDVRLVDRRGKRLTMTPAGLRIAGIVGQITGHVEAIERAATGERAEVSGEVTISAPPAFAAALLAEPLVHLRRAHPRLRLQVLGETRYASLGQRETDIAIRFGRPTAGDLTASKVGVIAFRLYGSPEYLASTAPANRSFIGYDKELDGALQQVAVRRLAGGAELALRLNTVELQIAMVKAGGGLAMLPDFLASEDPVLACANDDEAVHREVWLVLHTDMKGSLPVRLVANCLRDHLRRQLR